MDEKKKLKIVVVGIGSAGYATIDLLRKEKISSEIQTIKVNKDAVSTRVVSLEELEETNLVNINGENIVFGYINDKWEKMKCQMKDGDYLVEFGSYPNCWRHLASHQGIRHMRGEEIIGSMLTGMR